MNGPNSYLVSVVKTVVHESGDQGGLPHTLLPEEHEFKLPQRVSEVSGRRHDGCNFEDCFQNRNKKGSVSER